MQLLRARNFADYPGFEQELAKQTMALADLGRIGTIGWPFSAKGVVWPFWAVRSLVPEPGDIAVKKLA